MNTSGEARDKKGGIVRVDIGRSLVLPKEFSSTSRIRVKIPQEIH